ncbi:MAG: biotin--[acetyl-CoA-carboxylase] ligase [Rhodoferax sp.]|nr:biotin--[acetyl-CoA-carboxylase] ligase [Rhodoferax sp.]
MTLRWPAEAIWEAVSPQWPSFSVEILPEVDSTNTELMRRARQGQCDPVLLVAERQTAGRGRLGRDWHSDPQGLGNTLTFSLGVPLAPSDWSGLSLAVGLAVVQALHPDLQLKWPNDVWWQQRKLAGILIETASVGDARYAVIGIGINIGPRSTEGLRTPPAWLGELWPEATAPEALLRVAPVLVRAVQDFARQGFAPLRTAFHARDCLYGQAVVGSDGSHGVARGVDASGALLVHTEQGLLKISSAEVSVRPAADGLPAVLS